jgi:PAS domain S-box-containing protein
MASVPNVDAREGKTDLSSMSSNVAPTTPEAGATALVVIDLRGRVRHVNLAASQLLGRTVDQMRGLHWQDCLTLVDESTRTVIPDLVCACLTAGKPVQLGADAVLIDSRGAEIPVEGSVAPFRWLDDDVFGTVVMLRPGSGLRRQQAYSAA